MENKVMTRQSIILPITFGDVRNLQKPVHSKRSVNKSGKAIRGHIPYDGVTPDHLTDAFNIAHNWRISHIYPMHMVSRKLRLALDGVGLKAVTASRLKRMQSIRKKLFALSLGQIQDIAGCRAIVENIEDVERVVNLYRDGHGGYEIHKEDDYTRAPRPSGYRCHHIVLRFKGLPGREAHNNQRIELQIRTKNQHAWATAVEAVGLYRNEDMKAGKGEPDWLALFALMSDVLAERDGLVVDGDKTVRDAEIVRLSKKLDAVVSLENINQAIKYIDTRSLTTQFRYLIVQYNTNNKTLSVRPFANYTASETAYFTEEMHNWQANTVLIEMDRVMDLKEAYPNYFLDVSHFTDVLKSIHPYEKAVKVNPTIAQWMQGWQHWRNKK